MLQKHAEGNSDKNDSDKNVLVLNKITGKRMKSL